MTATVIPFPRWQRAAADLSTEALMRRVRFAALHAGCMSTDLPAVQSYAATMLTRGQTHTAVIQASRSFAAQSLLGPEARA